MARKVQCVRLKKEAEGLDFPPYPGEMGETYFRKCFKGSLDWLVKTPNHVGQ